MEREGEAQGRRGDGVNVINLSTNIRSRTATEGSPVQGELSPKVTEGL